eukprot:1140388-Pelagomonas_calceolata.AAC.4
MSARMGLCRFVMCLCASRSAYVCYSARGTAIDTCLLQHHTVCILLPSMFYVTVGQFQLHDWLCITAWLLPSNALRSEGGARLLFQVLKRHLAVNVPFLTCGDFMYEEGEGLEEDEVRMAALTS